MMPSGAGTSGPTELYPNGRFVNKINGAVLRHSTLGSLLHSNRRREQGAKLRRRNVGTLGSHAPRPLHELACRLMPSGEER